MQAKFEVKYLDINWYDKDTILSVQESFVPLKVEFDDKQSQFVCNTVIYPKASGIKHGQLAFRFLGRYVVEPYFELADKQRVPLKKIIDQDSGKIWWIEANNWIAKIKYWESKAHRTAGMLTVGLADQICQVNIGSSEFTAEQLNRYLSDFKSDLWELILDESSYVKGKAKKIQDGGVSEESIQLINHLISHADNLLKNPKSELREIQTLKPRKMVKPVNRTFMELATKGDGKLLTSRATEPSFNVPENRYILFALGRIYKIVKQLVTISKSKINRFENTVTKLNERLDAFSDVKDIDKDLVRRDLEKIKLSYNLKHLNDSLQQEMTGSACHSEPSAGSAVWYFKIGSKMDSGDSHFVGVKVKLDQPWFEWQRNVQNVKLKYVDESYMGLFEQGLEYQVCADVSCEKKIVSNRVNWVTYTLKNLTSIKIIGGEALQKRRSKFQSEKQKALALNDRSWVKQLNSSELFEQEREKKSIQKQLKFYEKNFENVKLVYQLLEPKIIKLKSLLTKLESMNIKPSPTFPNSMTFVRNPDYQSVHTGYKKIRDLTNLTDEDLLVSLEKVEEIGLINMPILYERWCLLQIVKVLVQNYHYTPSHDWKRRLLKIVSTGKHSESLDFSNGYVKRDIKLRYEPTLDSGRTPDFVMDVSFVQKNSNKGSKRFVMDAKFYSEDILRKRGGISSVIKELYHEKNYSEDDNNAVFVLHPAKGIIDKKISPQSWGENSYLGELGMFDWDKPLRAVHYHQYGAICANPVLRLSYLDEFQRMIGMFLQYGIEDNQLNRLPDDVESINFCISCGSHDLTPIKPSTSNNRSIWYECNTCKHFTTYNHCFGCDTRLIKNGDYWSYHSQMPMEPLNIKCPSCESLL